MITAAQTPNLARLNTPQNERMYVDNIYDSVKEWLTNYVELHLEGSADHSNDNIAVEVELMDNADVEVEWYVEISASIKSDRIKIKDISGYDSYDRCFGFPKDYIDGLEYDLETLFK